LISIFGETLPEKENSGSRDRQAGRHAEVAGSIPIKWGLVHPKKTTLSKGKKHPPKFPNVNIFYMLKALMSCI